MTTKMDSGANPKAASCRIRTLDDKRYAGQRKHDLRIGRQPEYVDSKRSGENRILVEPPPPGELRTLCETRRTTQRPDLRRAMRSDARIAVSGIVTFGTEAQKLFSALTPDAQDRAYRAAADRLADRLGTTLEGLVVHADESAPHAHFVLAGIDCSGRPVTEKLKAGMLRSMQDDVAAVMGAAAPGIERGRSRKARLAAGADYADTVNRSVRQLHADLPAEIAAKEAQLTQLAKDIEGQEAKRHRNERLAKRLEAKVGQLTAKQEKTLETYRRRGKDARRELEGLERSAVETRAERDRLGLQVAALNRRPGMLDRSGRAERIDAALEAAESDRAAAEEERRRAEADRQAVAAGAAEVVEASREQAEAEIRDFGMGAAAVMDLHMLPEPERGKWQRGPKFDGKRAAREDLDERPWSAWAWRALCGLRDAVVPVLLQARERIEQLRTGMETWSARAEAMEAVMDGHLTPGAVIGQWNEGPESPDRGGAGRWRRIRPRLEAGAERWKAEDSGRGFWNRLRELSELRDRPSRAEHGAVAAELDEARAERDAALARVRELDPPTETDDHELDFRC